MSGSRLGGVVALFSVDLDRGRPATRLARLAHGFALPFALLRAVRGEELLGARHRREVRRQWLVVGLLSVLLSLCSLSGVDEALDAGGTIVTSPSGGVSVRLGDQDPTKRAVELFDQASILANALLLVLSAIWATVKTVDWLVTAFLHEHDDALIHAVSARLGSVTEPPVEHPRVRFSVRWALGRLKRKLGGAFLIGLAAPVVALASLIPGGAYFRAALTSAWAFYWLAVYTTSKSAAAWNESEPPEPWFLRGWGTHTSPRGLRWWPLRLYWRLLRRVSTPMHSPCAAFARAPWELTGLTLVRILASLPLASTALRGVLPVAAGRILAAAEVPSAEPELGL
jgi:hypothetical protein